MSIKIRGVGRVLKCGEKLRFQEKYGVLGTIAECFRALFFYASKGAKKGAAKAAIS